MEFHLVGNCKSRVLASKADNLRKNFITRELRLPSLVGNEASRVFSTKTDNERNKFIAHELKLPSERLASLMCRHHPSLVQLAEDKQDFRSRILFLRSLKISVAEITESPNLLLMSSDDILTTHQILVNSGIPTNQICGHFLSNTHPVLSTTPLHPIQSALLDEQTLEINLHFLQIIQPHRTNVHYLAKVLDVEAIDVYDAALKSYAILTSGYKHGKLLSALKAVGMPSDMILKRYNKVRHRHMVLEKRLELMEGLDSESYKDLLKSTVIFQGEQYFQTYLAQASNRISENNCSSSFMGRAQFLSQLLNVSLPFVFASVETTKTGLIPFLYSERKILGVTAYLFSVGFSGTDLLHHPTVFMYSLKRVEKAVETVKTILEKSSLNSTHLINVTRLLAKGKVSRKHYARRVPPRYVWNELAVVLDWTPDALKKNCDKWTKMKITDFVKCDEDETIESLGECPLSRIKANIKELSDVGFRLSALSQVLFIVLHPPSTIFKVIQNYGLEHFLNGTSSNRIGLSALTMEEQIKLLNLVQFCFEKPENHLQQVMIT